MLHGNHLSQALYKASNHIAQTTVEINPSFDNIRRDKIMVRDNILAFLPLSLAKTHLIQDASHGSRNIQAITLLRLVIHTSVDKIGRNKNVRQLSSLSTFLRAKTHLIQDEAHGSFTIQAITKLKHASVDKISRDQNLIRLHILVFYFSLIKAYLIQDANGS